jgi:DNA primase
VTIPPAFLDEIRARVPLSDIVGRRLKIQRSGHEWKAPCPFHAEKTPSFYVNDQKAFFHCFGCGAHGDAVGFLMRHDGLAFPEAVEQLAAMAGMEMPRPEPGDQQKYDRLKTLADALEAAAKWFESQLHAASGREALAYLHGRGLDDRAIAEFRLGYAPQAGGALQAALTRQGHSESLLEEVGLIRRPDDGRAPYGFFRNRVIFPVADKRGRIIAFGGRILEGDGPKYVNSPEHALFHKGAVLYGLARARASIAKGDRPIVVEGYMDVIAFQRAGLGGAVAPLGTALTEAQLVELWKAQDPKVARDLPPVLCFDGDNAGRRAADRAIERVLPLLGPARSVAVAFLPQGEDPDSLVRHAGGAEAQKIVDAAMPLIDAVWQFAAAGRTLATPEQRAGLWAELDERIRAIADRQVQSLYRVELKRRFDALYLSAPFGGKRGERRGVFTAPGPRPAGVIRAGALEARVLLALIVNHPSLFDELSETFAEIPIPVAWEPLRVALFDILTREVLDAQSIKHQLSTSGYGPVLDDILGPATTGHARFVRPETPEDQVRAGWRDVWDRFHRRELERELAAVRGDPNRGDDKALKRISELGARRLEAVETLEHGQPGREIDHAVVMARAIAEVLKPKANDRRRDEAENPEPDFDV